MAQRPLSSHTGDFKSRPYALVLENKDRSVAAYLEGFSGIYWVYSKWHNKISYKTGIF